MIESILTSLDQPSHWHWFIAAVICIIFEIILPTFYLMWTGVGAFAVGVVLYFNPETSWSTQLLLFAALSVLSIFAGRYYLARNPLKTDEPLLNRRGEQYAGRVVTLNDPIVNGVGHISIDDTRWRVEGDDIDAGEKVEIQGLNGTSLVVTLKK